MNHSSMDRSFELLTIQESEKLLNVLKKMDSASTKLLIVLDSINKVKSLITIGDVQRAILAGKELTATIGEIDLSNKIIAYESWSDSEIKKVMLNIRCEFMPIVCQDGYLIKIIFWDELFIEQMPDKYTNINAPLVVMAGGKGTRLRPISNVLPKPLTPIGENTILEEILERFGRYGCNEVFVSVNYKKELIEYYMDKHTKYKDLNFFTESKPLGTAGSLSLLKDRIDSTFFLSNCDILIEQDLAEIYNYHKNNSNEVTVVSALKHMSIPYGTLKTEEGGVLTDMQEKPDLSMQINTGVYILEPHLINEIPEDTFFHITELIDSLIKQKRKVGVFPLSEKSWMDIGEWPEYIKTVRALSTKDEFLGL